MYDTRRIKGFTLIELMIAIIIIGILAAVAVPVYQSYAAKAQFSEAITVTEAIKLDAVSQIITDGSCKKATADINANYIESVETSTTETGACSITVTFKSSGVNSQLAGKNVVYTLSDVKDTVNWTCQTNVAADIATNCEQSDKNSGE